MKLYQKEERTVKNSLEVIDTNVLLEKASKGLLSLSVEIGFEVLRQLMEEEVTELVGKKGKHQKNRKGYRHGTEKTKVVLGAQKVSTTRPRVRSNEGGEFPLETLQWFQREDSLNQAVLARLLSGVSCRKYEQTLDTDTASNPTSCTSKSEISRRFITGMQTAMDEFFGRRLDGSYPAVMIDGMCFGKMTIVAAMGIRAGGDKQILGLIEGGSENTEVVKTLLSDLLERGLDPTESRLYVIDGGRALAKGIKNTFGDHAVIQRCQVHKKRNVLSKLPESEQANVGLLLSNAYLEFEYDEALSKLQQIMKKIETRYPSAAASLKEGMEETLTVHRLKLPGLLRKTLSNTNALESANSTCAGIIRRVTHFKNGEVALRQAVAGFMEAERSFCRIRGYREIPILQSALTNLTGIKHKDNIIKTA